MEWRVTIELNGADGTKQNHEVARGGGTDPRVLDGLMRTSEAFRYFRPRGAKVSVVASD
jgi:hypothetical protein